MVNRRPSLHAAYFLQDVIADPTLPRTKDVRCPSCNHNEAVFVSLSTESGMTLYFNCVNCRWVHLTPFLCLGECGV